jgi:hypothetical protein
MPISSGAGRVLENNDKISMKSVNLEAKPSTSSKERPFRTSALVYPKDFTTGNTTRWKKKTTFCSVNFIFIHLFQD